MFENFEEEFLSFISDKNPFLLTALCPAHQRPIRLICMQEKLQICDDCALFGAHRGHEVKLMKTISKDCKEQSLKLQEGLERLDKYQKDVNKLLEDKRSRVVEAIKNKFIELKAVVLKKELELIEKVNVFFHYERFISKEYLKENSGLKDELLKQSKQREKIFEQEDFFQVMEEDVGPILAKVSAGVFDTKVSGINNEVDEIAREVDKSLNTVISSVSRLDFNVKEFVQKHYKDFVGDKEDDLQLVPVNSPFEIKTDGKSLTLSLRDGVEAKEIMLDQEEWKKYNDVNFDIAQKENKEDISLLYYIWAKLDNVKSISLKFHPGGSCDKDLLRLFPVIFSKTKDLEEINLYLKACQVEDSTIASLFEKYLDQTPQLKHLTLYLGLTKVRGDCLQSLSKIQRNFESLVTLNIDLSNTMITDNTIAPLLSEMKLLKTFNLIVANTRINDITVERIMVNILANSLENFQLDLSGCQGVTDEAIMKLLLNIKDLRSFKLGLGFTKISQRAIQVLISNTIPKLRSLKRLWVGLEDLKIKKKYLEQVAALEKKYCENN